MPSLSDLVLSPHLGIFADQGDGGRNLESMTSLKVEMVAMIRRPTCTLNFWRGAYKQDRLRGDLVEFLDDNELVPFEGQEAVADEIRSPSLRRPFIRTCMCWVPTREARRPPRTPESRRLLLPAGRTLQDAHLHGLAD